MKVIYAAHVQCDACGAVADVRAPEGDSMNPMNPPGWLGMYQVRLTLSDGMSVGDICPGCASLPFAAVLERVNDRRHASAGAH